MTFDTSIVLVTYNRGQFLRRTLDTLMAQTYPDFELLIYDDCSTDDTEAICREYTAKDPRISYKRQPTRLGMPGNLNAGLQASNGEFLAGLHDGDLYAPTLIEKWREALIKHPSAGFVFNRYRHLDLDGTCSWVTPAFPELIPGHVFLDQCLADNRGCPVWGTVMGRRSVYEQLDWLNPRYTFWADIDLWLRIAEIHDIAHVPELLIDLPSKQNMPRLFANGFRGSLLGNLTVFKIYWAAKCRRYRHKPLSLAWQLLRQCFGYFSFRIFRRLVSPITRSRRA